MGTRIQLKRGTALEWFNANPTLAEGEQGLETDTNKIKIGNGTLAWNSLNYLFEDVSLDSPNFTGIPTAPTAAVGANTTQIATTAFVNLEISNDAILKTDIDTKGKLIVGSSAGPIAIAVGANNTVVQADSSTATGLKYAKIVGANIETSTTITTSGFYHTTNNVETWYGTTASPSSLPSASSFPNNTILVVT